MKRADLGAVSEYLFPVSIYSAPSQIIEPPENSARFNPSIGIIICKSKIRTRVEYTLKSSNKPIGVATYSYYETLPEEMRSLLPSPDEIAAIIRGMDGDDND